MATTSCRTGWTSSRRTCPKYAYDEAKAKQLLRRPASPAASRSSSRRLAVNESDTAPQSYLDKVGIKSDFRIVDTPTYNGIRTRGEFDISGRLLPAINPDTILFSYLHPDNIAAEGPQRRPLQQRRGHEAPGKRARAEPDFEKRKGLYAPGAEAGHGGPALRPEHRQRRLLAGYKWVTGVKINPLAQVGFYDVKLLAALRIRL